MGNYSEREGVNGEESESLFEEERECGRWQSIAHLIFRMAGLGE